MYHIFVDTRRNRDIKIRTERQHDINRLVINDASKNSVGRPLTRVTLTLEYTMYHIFVDTYRNRDIKNRTLQQHNFTRLVINDASKIASAGR
jgi:hypothetical protein